jgi:hypothetical protein
VEGPLTLTLSGDSAVGSTCEWNLQTRDDRVLMFTVSNSAEEQLLQSLNVITFYEANRVRHFIVSFVLDL